MNDKLQNNAHQQVQMVEIGPRHHGQRLDNFLITHLKGVPKSRVYKLLRSGQVRVNKGRKKADYRLQQADIVRIPPVRLREQESGKAPAHLLQQLKDSLIYEDDDLLIINKPAGMAVHGGSGVPFGVIEMLRQLRPNDSMLELVHRLDRDTSGCLVIARSRSALDELHQHFRDEHSEMRKIYRAILMGRWQGAERMIDAPLRKNTLRGGERMVEVSTDGKPARSLFTPLAYHDQLSLVEVELFTGRTHQIRVHAQSAGHPVAGDKKYGDPAFNQQLRQAGFKRMYLHAYQLAFSLKGKDYQFFAPLSDDWETLLNYQWRA